MPRLCAQISSVRQIQSGSDLSHLFKLCVFVASDKWSWSECSHYENAAHAFGVVFLSAF